MTRYRAALVIALALVAAALVALAPRYMEHWDEVQLELGMRQFDLAKHEPHPPGYVLFVLAGKAIAWVTHATHPGRVLSILAVLAWIVMVNRALAPSVVRPALIGATVFLSATFLIYATTGRTYVVEAVLWVATLLGLSRDAPRTTGALVSIGGGFRPTMLAWGALVSALRYRRRSVAMLWTLIPIVAVWAIALSLLAGGRYLELSAPLLRGNVLAKSMFVRGAVVLRERAPLMLMSLWEGLGPLSFAIPPLVVVRRRDRSLRRFDWLLIGAAVAFVFYLVVIYDSNGYSLAYVVPLLTWIVIVSDHAAARARPLYVAATLTGVLALWVVLPGGIASDATVLATRARQRVRYGARLAAIATLPPESTLLVTGAETFVGWSFRFAMYEAPAYPVVQLSRDRFVPALTTERPYFASVHRVTTSVGDGDVTALPFFRERALRYVVFTAPAEVTARVDASCAARASALTTTEGEALLVLEPSATLRVRIANGHLVCD